MPRVTMLDVANAAQVNKGTVSRALRGDKRISPETRERIWQAAKDLGYEVDAVASGLSSRRTGVIGAVFERLDSYWVGEFLRAAAGVLARCKIELLLMEADGSAMNIMRRVEGRKLDGLIWLGDSPFDRPLSDVPVVRISENEHPDEFRVGLEKEVSLQRVKELAGKRPVVYRGGEDALMSFLSELSVSSGAPAANNAKKTTCADEPYIIWDGLRRLPRKERPSLICGNEQLAALLGADCFRVPIRELGILSARVLINVLRETGVRPRATLLKTPLVSTAGELILG